MRTPRSELLVVAAVSGIVTAVLAAPVLQDPTTRLFGAEIVGRHHDPFTAMQRFAGALWTSAAGPQAQPVTDLTGAVLARVIGPVAAYNAVVLLSFPFAALAAYLLARHLQLSPIASGLAALAFAFSPFHLAQAAYHPHVAQVQWIPLYLLALWRCLDSASRARLAALALAAMAVTWSNYYGGLIAGLLTPVAIAGYWACETRTRPGAGAHIVRVVAMLVCLGLGGVAYLIWTIPAVFTAPESLAFPRSDLFAYSAKWWSYGIPPVANPWFGDTARHIWSEWNVGAGLLEHQVSVGLGLIALAGVALTSRVRWVPLLVVVAAVALVCSLSPERTIEGVRVLRPSALLYDLVPMFRSYARFGVAVQLMVALLAAVGFERLWRSPHRMARIGALVLATAALIEYTVWPSALWRDVLPTAAHRAWLAEPADAGILDCAPLTAETQSIEWLTGGRIRMVTDDSDCLEPDLPGVLAAEGYRHVIVRTGSPVARHWSRRSPPDGLTLIATVPGARVFAVTAAVPPLFIAHTSGFHDRETNDDWSWRWMGDEAAWIVVNPGQAPVTVVLTMEVQAFGSTRSLDLRLDGLPIADITASPLRTTWTSPPVTVDPGPHTLSFAPRAPASAADALQSTGDQRRLSVAIGSWRWVPQGPAR